MNKNKILICDDIPATEETWKERLEAIPRIHKEFEIVAISPDDLRDVVAALEDRRKTSRKEDNSEKEFPDDAARQVDTTGILIIDYDLIDLSQASYLTGEDVAYLARCYSDCGLIVALNQFERGENVFDLTLKGHIESFADLNISDPQLDNPGLWTEEWGTFRPWSWPLLPQALEKMERRVEELRSCLDAPILEYLEVSDDDIATCPRSTLEFITPLDQIARTTFNDFVTNSPIGLRGKDRVFSELTLARVAAARVAKWLETVVLPGQNFLVDGPHLVSRYPSLVHEGSQAIEAWNKTATLTGYDDTGIYESEIKGFRFARSDWLGRPSWFWNKVSSCEAIPEVKQPWESRRPDYVFCEDVSRFVPSNEASQFVADLDTPFVRRFVNKLENIKYKPLVRFSL